MDDRIRASFARQGLMQTLGACIVRVEPGRVVIELPFSDAVTQQHGYFHAAAMAAIADTAGGYAALTLMEPHEEVLAVEFKINLLKPATGASLVAEASVVRAGRTLIVCQANVKNDADEVVAVMMQTNFRVRS
ncbi:MAG TPA: PaaI family thioesterase [Thermoanaerobaculia bacterium]|nr:PaaI family thioesterase [Thermoanaerobaculia bacterium]